MARGFNVSVDAIGQSIVDIDTLKENLNNTLQSFSSQIGSMSGRDWNEETGANNNNNLDLAKNDIKNIIEQLNSFELVLNQIKAEYEEERASYNN